MSIDRNGLIEILKDFNQEQVERFIAYVRKMDSEKYTSGDKKGQVKNYWMSARTNEILANSYKNVVSEGLDFDGVHVTLQSTGISYDYIAYKNKMLISYPESIIDINLVYKGDDFAFEKKSGKVDYHHKIGNPFEQKEGDIIGGYIVIKNKRGEFLTTLSADDIEKHRKVAKTDYIWRAWFKEMCMKTIFKKGVKYHFSDIYTKIEEVDNENYDIENPVDLDLKYKQEMEEIDNLEELKIYYIKNKGRGKSFDKMVTKRKEELTIELK